MKFGSTSFGLSVAAAIVFAMAPAQASQIVGQFSGFGSAGAVISQNGTDFQDPVGGGTGTFSVGSNVNNATDGYSPLLALSGTILDFAGSGAQANFIDIGNYEFSVVSFAAGSNYGGQNVWLFQDIVGGVIGTLVANGTVVDKTDANNTGSFQATFTTQFQSTTSAQLIASLSGGSGSLNLQSYSVSVQSDAPEPGTWAMMLSGLGLVVAGARTRRRKS